MRRTLLLALLLAVVLPASARIIRVDAFECTNDNGRMQPGTQECWDPATVDSLYSATADFGYGYLVSTITTPLAPRGGSLIRGAPDFIAPRSHNQFDATGAGGFGQTPWSSMGFGGIPFQAFDLVAFMRDTVPGYDPTTIQPRTGRLMLNAALGQTQIEFAWGLRNTDLSDTSDTRYLDPNNPSRADPSDQRLFRVTWYFDSLRDVLINEAGLSPDEAENLLDSVFELDQGPLHRDSRGRALPAVQLISGLDDNGYEVVQLTGLKTSRYSSGPGWDGATQSCFEFAIAAYGAPVDSCASIVVPTPVPEPPVLLLVSVALGVSLRLAKRRPVRGG